MTSRLRVTADYQAIYPDPIQVVSGEEINLDLEKKTDIPGWVWGTSRAGKSGWVPETYLARQDGAVRIRQDYDAIELTIHAGDLLTGYQTESSFIWVKDRRGRQGWVPLSHVEPLEPAQKMEEQ